MTEWPYDEWGGRMNETRQKRTRPKIKGSRRDVANLKSHQLLLRVVQNQPQAVGPERHCIRFSTFVGKETCQWA